MKRIFFTTLFSTLLGCFVFGFLLLFSNESPGLAVYVAVLAFGNIILPTLLGVLLFQIVRRKINFSSQTKTLVFRITTLIIIFAIGLVLWAIGDIVLFHGDFSGLTIGNIVKDFDSQFLGFTPIVLCLAIAIPLFDILLSSKNQKTKSPT